jgi:hypothetical protein
MKITEEIIPKDRDLEILKLNNRNRRVENQFEKAPGESSEEDNSLREEEEAFIEANRRGINSETEIKNLLPEIIIASETTTNNQGHMSKKAKMIDLALLLRSANFLNRTRHLTLSSRYFESY